MTTGRGWYVKGRKLAFPNGARLCSGPFDAMAEEIDPRCAFDFFGTSRVEGVPLPVGVLNDRCVI